MGRYLEGGIVTRRFCLAMLLACPLVGCMVPVYKMPAGFSSTYYRSIYQANRAGNDGQTLSTQADTNRTRKPPIRKSPL